MRAADRARSVALIGAVVSALGFAACTAPAEAPARPERTVPKASTVAPPDISADAVKAHLEELQRITDAGGGTRATGRPAAAAAVEWLRRRLNSAGYQTMVQDVPTPRGAAQNLLAESPDGDPDRVLMLGAHLDSVRAGPGINDNGSGVGTLLEIAIRLSASGAKPAQRVRFGFWGAEEIGLFGSRHYVDNLPVEERERITGYLNFDMLASPNPGYFYYDAGPDSPEGSAQLKKILAEEVAQRGVAPEEIDVGGRSDHGSFAAAGIPVAGLFSGADAAKSAAQAMAWGGTAGKPFDPCYHRACDTSENIDLTALDRHSDAIADALWQLAVQAP